ncbi:MAG: hypothetical protein ACRD0A_12950 [Acidimicrobiales bacterium]
MGIVRYTKSTAYRRGVVGSSRPWLAIWILLTAVNWLRRHAGKAEEPVLRLKIEPGERLLITHEPPPVKTRRRDREGGG